MDTEIKIDANLNKALELLCEKLGVAATEIIPHYAKVGRMRAIGGIIRGILSVTLPFALFFIKIPVTAEYVRYGTVHRPEGWMACFLICKIVVCLAFVCGGIVLLTDYFEEFFASEGRAIERLIDQLID